MGSGSSTPCSRAAAVSAPAPRRSSAIFWASASSVSPMTDDPTVMTLGAVPIIDVAPFLTGAPSDKRRVAGEVGGACEELGFLIVSGHGVPPDLVADMYEVSKRFFELPLPEKMKARGQDRSRGYGALGEEALSYGLGKAAPADVKEGLYEGPMDVP